MNEKASPSPTPPDRRLRPGLSVLDDSFAISKLAASDPVPEWSQRDGLVSVTRTLEELSIVCPERHVPSDIWAHRGWRCLEVSGPLDLDMVGVSPL